MILLPYIKCLFMHENLRLSCLLFLLILVHSVISLYALLFFTGNHSCPLNVFCGNENNFLQKRFVFSSDRYLGTPPILFPHKLSLQCEILWNTQMMKMQAKFCEKTSLRPQYFRTFVFFINLFFTQSQKSSPQFPAGEARAVGLLMVHPYLNEIPV